MISWHDFNLNWWCPYNFTFHDRSTHVYFNLKTTANLFCLIETGFTRCSSPYRYILLMPLVVPCHDQIVACDGMAQPVPWHGPTCAIAWHNLYSYSKFADLFRPQSQLMILYQHFRMILSFKLQGYCHLKFICWGWNCHFLYLRSSLLTTSKLYFGTIK